MTRSRSGPASPKCSPTAPRSRSTQWSRARESPAVLELKPAIDQIERRRLALQQARDRLRSQQQRNRLGQFATPSALARETLEYAHELPGSRPVRFLDPAIGTGAFYAALLREWPVAEIDAATGFEIDAHYGEPCRALWQGTRLRLRLEDFTAAAVPAEESERFNLVICNPPYVRHHHLQPAAKARLQQRSTALNAGRRG